MSLHDSNDKNVRWYHFGKMKPFLNSIKGETLRQVYYIHDDFSWYIEQLDDYIMILL